MKTTRGKSVLVDLKSIIAQKALIELNIHHFTSNLYVPALINALMVPLPEASASESGVLLQLSSSEKG